MRLRGGIESEGLRRGDLLELASFLTEIQSHLVPEGLASCLVSVSTSSEKPSGSGYIIINPRDIENVFDYRSLLDNEKKLEEQSYIFEEMGRSNKLFFPLSRLLMEKLEYRIDDAHAQVQDCTTRTKQIDHMLRRFDVWGTKLLAQQLFVSPARDIAEDPSKTMKQCCFSAFLNLPCSTYFSNILPEAIGGDPPVTESSSSFHKHSVECCSLPLPPNKHTWKEFARLSRMVGLLDASGYEQAQKSPCCVNDLNRKRSNPSYSQTYEFRPPDLVALWVRAQRNTQAMRQLWMLFEIETNDGDSAARSFAIQGTGTKGSGKRLVVDLEGGHRQNSGESHLKPPSSLKAILRGNHNYTRQRIVDMSNLVDQLVEWAVVNQVIFTYRHIQHYILTEPIRKKKTSSDLSELYRRPAKRTRRDFSKGMDLFELKQACQAYVLRWFARRNRRATSFLFSSHLDHLKLDLGSTKSDRVATGLLIDSVKDKIQEYLDKPEISDKTAYRGDRTFARLDRRLFIRERYDQDITVYSQMQALLSALDEASPENQLDKSLIESARSDFQELYDHFFAKGKDVYETALDLVDLENASIEEMAQTLKSAPCPWAEKCSVCDTDDPKTMRTCVNCERIYHDQCSPNCKTVRLNNAIAICPPLGKLCKLKRPDNIPVPDSHGIEWTTKLITIERNRLPDGRVQPFGLILRQTEECVSAFESLQKDGYTVADLASMIDADNKAKPPRNTFPLAIDHRGCLIIEAKEGDVCGKSSGLQAGDVITEVELIDFVSEEDAAKYKDSKVINFTDTTIPERLEVLKLKTTKLRLKVLRPNKDIVEISRSWYSNIKRLNKNFSSALRDDDFRLFYCGECLEETPRPDQDDQSSKVFQEAENCRAVIRRLGMESYALPFIEENPERVHRQNTSIQVDHSQFVSLRRLDSMMTYVMEKHSSRSSRPFASNAFLLPPWAKGGPIRQRLVWAPENLEERPMELLCRAMGILDDLALAETDDSNKRNKKGLFRHFLFAFSSWCVLSSDHSTTCLTTKGPPEIFRVSRTPWLLPSCSFCCARPCDDNEGNRNICNNPSCCVMLDDVNVQMEDVDEDEARKISIDFRKYNECASLVGTSFLVLPNDPLVSSVSSIVQIDHDDRPVEFIVASYVPPEFVSETTRDRPKDNVDRFEEGGGIFHLLPVVTVHQLRFLLERCKMRNPRTYKDSGGDMSWAYLGVLDLEGVARYSWLEVQKKIMESVTIRHAIDETVALGSGDVMAQQNNRSSSGVIRTEDSRIDSLPSSCSFDNADPVALRSNIIGSLLYGIRPPSVIGDMLSGEETELSSTLSSKPADAISYTDPFETLVLQRGATCLNPPTTPILDISVPAAVETNCCVLYYSDLHFESMIDFAENLENIMKPDTLSRPQQPDTKKMTEDSVRTLLLSRLADSDRDDSCNGSCYKGIGWGFELVRWTGEDMLRVGRLCVGSTAYDAGLLTNDIIIAADGKRLGSFKNQAELITTILGASSTRVRLNKSGKRTIVSVLSVVKSLKPAMNPVVLRVYTPSSGSGGDQINRSTSLSAVCPKDAAEVHAQRQKPPVEANSYRGSGMASVARFEIPRNLEALNNRASERPIELSRFQQLGVGRGPSFEAQVSHFQQPEVARGPSLDEQVPRLEHPSAVARGPPLDEQVPRLEHPSAVARGPSFDEQVPRLQHPSAVAKRPSFDAREHRDTFKSLLSLVYNTCRDRPPVSLDHLYLPASNETILTVLEVAVFLECLLKKQPKLGLRLLCPRYDLRLLYKQAMAISKWSHRQVNAIPRISKDMYWTLLQVRVCVGYYFIAAPFALFSPSLLSFLIPIWLIAASSTLLCFNLSSTIQTPLCFDRLFYACLPLPLFHCLAPAGFQTCN
jgi:hypothetical protein